MTFRPLRGHWVLILDSPNGWRCTQCSDFFRTGWIYYEKPAVATPLPL
jgi:hypothetical protein